MNDYDQAARFATKINPTGFFGWAFRAAFTTLRFRGWMDTRTLPFPGEPDRICDTVAEFEDTSAPGRTLIAVVEFQSQPRGDMLNRLWEYKARFLNALEKWEMNESAVVARWRAEGRAEGRA